MVMNAAMKSKSNVTQAQRCQVLPLRPQARTIAITMYAMASPAIAWARANRWERVVTTSPMSVRYVEPWKILAHYF